MSEFGLTGFTVHLFLNVVANAVRNGVFDNLVHEVGLASAVDNHVATPCVLWRYFEIIQ